MSGTSWPPWTKRNQADRNEANQFTSFTTYFNGLAPGVRTLTTFALGSATAISALMLYKRYGRRIRNSGWITPKVLTKKRWLKGVATSVGDADNFRFFHTPALGGYTWPVKLRSIPSLSKDLKDETIHIRIAGVDAPEAAHFGKPAQPYAAESLLWLRNQILGKTVYCQLLRRDQYSRIAVMFGWRSARSWDFGSYKTAFKSVAFAIQEAVLRALIGGTSISTQSQVGLPKTYQTVSKQPIIVAQVYLAPRILPGFLFHGKNVSAEMLKAGWAVTYEQAGAEYGKLGKDEFVRLEAEAKAARRGMWKGGKLLETPSQYKRRHAAAATLEEAEAAKSRLGGLSPKKSWLSSLFTRS